jgi:hypothetical protein
VYKGANYPDNVIADIEKAYESGQPYEMKGFVSTSTDREVALDFIEKDNPNNKVLLFIHSKKGKDINELSDYGPNFSKLEDEKEVLMKSKTRYKVEEIEEVESEEFGKVVEITLIEK